METMEEIMVKSITLIRNKKQKVMKIAKTSNSNDIIHTIGNVFNLPIESDIILIEHDTDEILCNAAPIFFWTNPSVTPTYRIVIRGELIAATKQLQTALATRSTTMQSSNPASIIIPTYRQTDQLNATSIIEPLINVAIPLLPAIDHALLEELQGRYDSLPNLEKYQVTIFYHVTSEYCKEKIQKEQMLRETKPRDATYDKGLVQPNIYGVFGNTNIGQNGDLPDITQYPRNGAKRSHPRIRLLLNELNLHTDMYDMFFVWQEGIQQLVAFFPRDHPQLRYMQGSLLPLDKTDNKILSYVNQCWGCPLYKNKDEGMFTNVFIANDIPLTNLTCQWDSARKI